MNYTASSMPAIGAARIERNRLTDMANQQFAESCAQESFGNRLAFMDSGVRYLAKAHALTREIERLEVANSGSAA